jgi:integrase
LAALILETGVRPGEAACNGRTYASRRLFTQNTATLSFVVESRATRHAISGLPRAAEMLMARKATTKSVWVFPGETNESAILVTSLDHQHDDVRTALNFPKDFVIHSLRHTMLTCLGEAGTDAFTIMKIAGHSSVTVSQRYVHPTPEGMDRAFDRLEASTRISSSRPNWKPKRKRPEAPNTPQFPPHSKAPRRQIIANS